jgi:hypothetical protein
MDAEKDRTDPDRLREENSQVLRLVQALIGAITPSMRAIALEWYPPRVGLHFLLERDDPRDRDEIADIASEFEALQDGPLDLDVVITVTDARLPVVVPWRMVYRRNEPSEDA